MPAQNFFALCGMISKNWQEVKSTMLVDCHDEYPSTDVVYALAYRITDPTNKKLIDYEWFKFIHNKVDIQGHSTKYLLPFVIDEKIIYGSQRLHRPWHYFEKHIPEEMNARVF